MSKEANHEINFIKPEPSSEKEIAHQIIEEILNHMLNRHIHELENNNFLNKKKFNKEARLLNNTPEKKLQIKRDLIDEAQEKFTSFILDKIKDQKKKK